MKYTDLCEQANKALQGVTEGPWAWNVRGFVGPASTEDDQSFGMICDEVAECNYSDGRKEANARFIAFARAWVPEAAAALTALSEQNVALAAQVAELTRERDVLTTSGIVEIASRNNRVTEYMFHWEGRALDAEAEVARLEGALSDPVAVHANMLRGTIAKPTVEQIIHIYGADALRAALTEGTPDE